MLTISSAISVHERCGSLHLKSCIYSFNYASFSWQGVNMQTPSPLCSSSQGFGALPPFSSFYSLTHPQWMGWHIVHGESAAQSTHVAWCHRGVPRELQVKQGTVARCTHVQLGTGTVDPASATPASVAPGAVASSH